MTTAKGGRTTVRILYFKVLSEPQTSRYVNIVNRPQAIRGKRTDVCDCHYLPTGLSITALWSSEEKVKFRSLFAWLRVLRPGDLRSSEAGRDASDT